MRRFCAYELTQRGFPESLVYPRSNAAEGKNRVQILGGYMPKEVDVCVTVPDNGPLVAISWKSLMPSTIRNAINRFEEYIGDAMNLHARFPMLVLGFMVLFPTSEKFLRNGKPADELQRFADLIERSNARCGVMDPSGSYEASCLLLVDFEPHPPRLSRAFPPKASSLRVEQFFDKLWELYQQRNQFVKL